MRLAVLLPAVLVAQVPPQPWRASPAVMPGVLARYEADRDSLNRYWTVPEGPGRRARFAAFRAEWARALNAVDAKAFSPDDRLDLLLFRRHLAAEADAATEAERRRAELAPLLPGAEGLRILCEARRRRELQDPKACAEQLHAWAEGLRALARELEGGTRKAEAIPALRAAVQAAELQAQLKAWAEYSQGYDPLFTWWCAQPVKALDAALAAHAELLKARFGGLDPKDKDAIHGDPIGREALQRALADESIAYTPEEILEIGRREMAWCEAELRKAARDLGCGDDWRAALEKVKGTYAAPGEQPRLIRELAEEAVSWLEQRKLIRIPALAKEDWRMEMMSPERQKVAPFFLGGESILVSYPTADMAHGDKLMSLRGNNPAFSRAVVHHELIPGHHLQLFMNARHAAHRRMFETPFSIEGWALYWELRLWDLGFARTPAERIGMLFWRMHRCARIFFSFGFHLGQLTPKQCVDLLVEQVGHERANAEGEVRRSLQGGYGPLYQAAYMVGGLQYRALHRELVGTGKLSEPDFHDAVLMNGPIPVELLRAKLLGLDLGPAFKPAWRFYGELTARR